MSTLTVSSGRSWSVSGCYDPTEDIVKSLEWNEVKVSRILISLMYPSFKNAQIGLGGRQKQQSFCLKQFFFHIQWNQNSYIY